MISPQHFLAQFLSFSNFGVILVHFCVALAQSRAKPKRYDNSAVKFEQNYQQQGVTDCSEALNLLWWKPFDRPTCEFYWIKVFSRHGWRMKQSQLSSHVLLIALPEKRPTSAEARERTSVSDPRETAHKQPSHGGEHHSARFVFLQEE